MAAGLLVVWLSCARYRLVSHEVDDGIKLKTRVCSCVYDAHLGLGWSALPAKVDLVKKLHTGGGLRVFQDPQPVSFVVGPSSSKFTTTLPLPLPLPLYSTTTVCCIYAYI